MGTEKSKQEIYGALIFLSWIGIVLLSKYFVPGAALFIREFWCVFGVIGFLVMLASILKSKSFKQADVIVLLGMIVLGPVGILGYLSWLALVKIQHRRKLV
jgi:hypothetical protein